MKGVRVEASGLSLKGPQGWVFRDVSVTAQPGELVCLAGPSGSGRTSLLLTLAGRMRHAKGKVEVGGVAKPRRIQRLASLALLAGVNDLEPRLTVGEHARERLTGLGWGPWLSGTKRTAESLAAVGLDVDTKALTSSLNALELTLFGVALALLERPRLVLVDDVGRGVTAAHTPELWARLAALPVTVIAATVDPPPHASRVVPLPLERG